MHRMVVTARPIRNTMLGQLSSKTRQSMPKATTTTTSPPARRPADAALRMPLGDTDPFVPTDGRPVRVRGRSMRVDAHFEPHRHEWAQLAYCSSGVVQVTIATPAETTYIVPPTRGVWIAPGTLHSITVLEAAEFRTLYVHASAIPPGWQDCRVLTVSPLARELILALDGEEAGRRRGTAPDAPASERERLLMATLAGELGRADIHQALGVPLPHPGSADKRLRALCEAVLREPASRATLAERAAQFGASERTMARLFRDELGLGYQQWRQQAMLAHALPLLARGLSVAEVATATGYASESAFSAMFKAALGEPPRFFLRRKQP
jgi:AraC-like DNA-binding protein